MNKFLIFLDSINILNNKNRYLVLLFSILCFVLSVTQIFGLSRDYKNYDDFFNFARIDGYLSILESRFEPGFSILSLLLVSISSSNLLIYSFFVFFSTLMKGSVISFYSASEKVFILACILYLVRYFPLHELTQLRLSIGIAFILSGSVLLWSGRLFSGSIVCGIALLFHMSLISIVPFLFIIQLGRYQIILFSLFAFLFTKFSVNIINEYLSGFIQVLSDYEVNKDPFEKSPNPIAIYILIDLSMVIWSFFYWKHLSEIMRSIIFIELIGFSIFYGAIDFSAIAIRVRELYSVFWIIFSIEGLKKNETKIPVYIFIIANLFFYSYLFFLYKEIPFFNTIQ